MNKFFRVPFALSGTRTPVPDAADPSGFVSYIEGYGADYQRPKTDPLSKNIERDKMNEIFFDATTAIAELQSQGIPDFITTALNGGSPYPYAKNAMVRYTDGELYVSLVAANTALPTDATKWGPASFTALADPVTAGKGASLIGWIRGLAGSVATTLKSFLGWQEINAFEFMTIAQIASWKAGDDAQDFAVPLQAWVNACAASAASGGGMVGRLPPGGGRTTVTLTVPNATTLRGHGKRSAIKGWGVSVFQLDGDFASIEDMILFGYTNAGVADPRTQDAITTTGVLATKNNFITLRGLYLQGWNRAVDFQYVDNSVIENISTVNCNYGVRYFGQCVNNSISNSRLVANGGTASVHCAKNGSDQGEGLMVTNTLCASGANAFLSDGFLSVGFYNCICDLHAGNAFECTSVIGLAIDCPWVFSSAGRCVNFNNPGVATTIDARISIGLATAGGAVVVAVATNNNSVVIASGIYSLTNAAGVLPIILAGNVASVGPIIVRNATTNSDLQVGGTDIRISQEAILPKGVQYTVSQIRSVASGATTTLPFPTGAQIEQISVTGNTNCTTLNDPAAWPGKIVALRFTGTPTWSNGGNLKLNGNFVATADDVLVLTSDGTNWFEMSRSAN